eukprot:8263851-Pyramimonas_sp.AAC.1
MHSASHPPTVSARRTLRRLTIISALERPLNAAPGWGDVSCAGQPPARRRDAEHPPHTGLKSHASRRRGGVMQNTRHTQGSSLTPLGV